MASLKYFKIKLDKKECSGPETAPSRFAGSSEG